MNKAIVNMTNWELYVYDEYYSLSGIADRHPTIGNNAYVSQTSQLVDYSFENNQLIYETKNTIYVCPLKYMALYPYKNVIPDYKMKLTHRADNSSSILDAIISISAKISLENDREKKRTEFIPNEEGIDYENFDYSNDQFLKEVKNLQIEGQKEIKEAIILEDNRLIENAQKYEDCIYLEVSCVSCGDKLAYHLGKYAGTVSPRLHVGMFQDSVLYMKYGSESEVENALDFRYFPKGYNDVLETYSWSDNIKQAVIKNVCNHIIQFNGKEIEPECTEVFTQDSHSQGLISPDCYNGKSLVGNNIQE